MAHIIIELSLAINNSHYYSLTKLENYEMEQGGWKTGN